MHLNRLLRCAITTTLLLVLAGLVSVTATVATHKPAIVDITDANVDAVLTADSEWLVVVYASWCGHCNHFKPEVAKLGEMLASSKHPVRLGRVDYEENPVIISRFFTASLPTVYHIKNRVVRTIEFGDALQEYGNGGRNAATLFALVGGASAKNGDVRPVEKVVEAWPAVWSPFGTLAMTMGTVVSFASAAKPFMESLVDTLRDLQRNYGKQVVAMVWILRASIVLFVIYLLYFLWNLKRSNEQQAAEDEAGEEKVETKKDL